MIDSLSGGLGDLPADVIGSRQQAYLKFPNETSIIQEETDLDRVLSGMSQTPHMACIPNTEYRTRIQESPREPVDVQKQKAETVRAARWMIMHNEPTLKIEQQLEKAVNDGLLTPVEAAAVRSETLLGRLYLDRNVASKCSDIRKASQHRDARHALYVVMSNAGDCKECEKQFNGICPESGRKLIAEVPAGKTELRESCRHMAERGRILSNANINDWNDLKLALAPQKAEENIRMYPHASPVGPILSQRIGAQQQNTILNEAAINKQQATDAVHQELDARTVVPVARKIAELLLKGTEWAVAREEVERIFPDKAVVDAAIAFLKKNSDPALLVSHLAAFPSLYGDCQKCRDFLRTNSIRVANVFPTAACKDCKWRDNPTRSCSLIGARVLEKTGIGPEDVNQAIDEFRAEGRLASNQAKCLKEIPELRRRLSEAVRMAFTSTEKTDPPRVGRNAFIGSAANFASKENLVIWAQEALSRKASMAEIKKELKKHRTDAEQIACDALASMNTIHADSLDACLHDQYVFSSNARLVPANKCSTCPHADQMQCRRHGVAFSLGNGLNETDDVNLEAREILSYFADSNLVAEVDPDNTKKTIDIQFKNEGAEMTIDLGKNDASGAITNYQQLYDFLGPNVEVGPRMGGMAPMDIQGLGGEMDISSIL
jgi:hypothetical protein